MEEANKTTSNPQDKPFVFPLSKKSSFFNKKFLIFVIVFFLILLITGCSYLILNSINKTENIVSTLINLPSPTPPFNLKTYTNTKYGFTFSYPAKGITQKGKDFLEVECGDTIKETTDLILVDNLFKIQILDWTKTIDDYLISKGAKKTYEVEQMNNTGADEAVKVLGIKKGLELVSVGYPALMNVSAIYKKGNRLFLIVNFEDASNAGCINPKDLDHTKYAKYVEQNWDISNSFKFSQNPSLTKCVDQNTKAEMNFDQALAIAQKSECVKNGQLKSTYFCNENSGTWWIDLEPSIKKEGCNPACVINANTKQAEINWRCTGLKR